MDEKLTLRFEVYEGTPGTSRQSIEFVKAEIDRLEDAGEQLTDDRAGTFVSHLIVALNRVERGEGLESFAASEVIDDVVRQHPDVLARSRDLAERARTALGIELPETEVRFLVLHLAALTVKRVPRHLNSDD